MTHTVYFSNCSMQSGFASFVDFFPINGSSGCDAVSVLCLLGLFTVSRFASCTSNVTTQLAPLRDRWFAVSARASRHCTLQQRGLLLARSGSSSWSLEIRCRCGSSVISNTLCASLGCVHPHNEGFHRGLLSRRGRLVRPTPRGVPILVCLYRMVSLSLSHAASLRVLSGLYRHVLRNVIRTAVSCD